jgi:hypothetical protein
MKRNLIGSLPLVALSLLLTSTGAHAQSAVKANVPFAFNVGSRQLPPGNYIVTVDELQNRVKIQNAFTCATISLLGLPEQPGQKTEKLVFQNVGNQHFLTEVWGAAGTSGMQLRGPKVETQMEIAKQPAQSSKGVMIALK